MQIKPKKKTLMILNKVGFTQHLIRNHSTWIGSEHSYIYTKSSSTAGMKYKDRQENNHTVQTLIKIHIAQSLCLT